MRGLKRLVRAVKLLAADGNIPRPLRGLALFGLAPLPGPLDEAALLLAGILLLMFHRQRMVAAWRRASTQ